MNTKTIKDICREYGYSQTALAKRFGIPLRTVQNWHGGQREPAPYVVPMMEEILRLDAKNKELTEDNFILKQKRANIFEIGDAYDRGKIKGVQEVIDKVENLLDENECMVGSGVYYYGSLKHDIEELKKKYPEDCRGEP